jgi:hypothetical protein
LLAGDADRRRVGWREDCWIGRGSADEAHRSARGRCHPDPVGRQAGRKSIDVLIFRLDRRDIVEALADAVVRGVEVFEEDWAATPAAGAKRDE